MWQILGRARGTSPETTYLGGMEGWPHWAGEIKKAEGPMKKRGPGKGSTGEVE